MRLIRECFSTNHHVSQDTIDEFERSILKDGSVKSVSRLSQLCFYPLYIAEKLCSKLGFSLLKNVSRSVVFEPSVSKSLDFMIMMGIDDDMKYYPYAFFSKRMCSIYLFDAWTEKHKQIVEFVTKHKIKLVFVSSSQVSVELNKNNSFSTYWVPEGIDPTEYKSIPYEAKDIDVLALGRKYDVYHDTILPYFESTDKVYFYEKNKGEIVFPSRDEFINGLSRSKISICVPSSITHPERSANISTMTVRYLQSMLSKCLIVGSAPQEMIDLFGYNPVIEIDMNDSVNQLDTILNNFSDYIPLIEMNYQKVLEGHTWSHRWQTIKAIIKKEYPSLI